MHHQIIIIVLFGILNFAFSAAHNPNIKNKSKNIKMIGKTASFSYPIEWWPFVATKTIPLDIYRTHPTPISISLPNTFNYNIKTKTVEVIADKVNANYGDDIKYIIKATIFVDFKKSREYKRLWFRTHRGLHWLPPRPT